MHIKITDAASAWLRRKQDFYASRQRVPHIILAAQSCRGAEFRLHFENVAEQDIILTDNGISLYADKDMAERFGGFDIDIEMYFFASRLLIKPVNDIKQCSCKGTTKGECR